jgi:hypothetical protein
VSGGGGGLLMEDSRLPRSETEWINLFMGICLCAHHLVEMGKSRA